MTVIDWDDCEKYTLEDTINELYRRFENQSLKDYCDRLGITTKEIRIRFIEVNLEYYNPEINDYNVYDLIKSSFKNLKINSEDLGDMDHSLDLIMKKIPMYYVIDYGYSWCIRNKRKECCVEDPDEFEPSIELIVSCIENPSNLF